jgi:integrase/recombinase XerD
MSTPRPLSYKTGSVSPNSIDYLFTVYLDHHRARGSSQSTISHYISTQLVFIKFLAESEHPADVKAFTTPVINSFAQWLRETPTRGWRGNSDRTVTTIHGHLKDLRAVVRWLHQEELLEKIPRIVLPRLPQTMFPILSDTDLQVVFASPLLNSDSEAGLRNRALFAFMLDTATRMSEVATLQWQQLDLKDGSAKVLGKGNKERFVFVSDQTVKYLRAWAVIRGTADGSVFWLKPAGIRMLFDRIKKNTGLGVFHPHQIRHTAITMFVRKNVDLHTVRRIAGHSTLTVTEKYLSLDSGDLKRSHSSASPVEHIMKPESYSLGKERRLSRRR